MDHRKEWRTAERLLKQGNVPAALEQLRKVTASSEDVLTLNRLGDLLAREGRNAEAIGYYVKIAQTFERGGFGPKAIAIHKKILRLDPGHLDSAIRLGLLYGQQQMNGEARKYLLHAANRRLEGGDLARAREVFQQLAELEPDDLRHRVRLAEVHVAEGAAPLAVEQLTGVGEALLARGEPLEAEKVFERAHELAPEAQPVLVGLARCREAGGRPEQAIAALEALAAGGTAPAVAELARLYVVVGRAPDALRLLSATDPAGASSDAWERLFAAAVECRAVVGFWKWLDRKLAVAPGSAPRSDHAALLEQLASIEPDGHVPALERLAALHERAGHVAPAVQALDALARAYRASGREADATATLERMRQIAPPDEEPWQQPAPEPDDELPIEPTSLAGPAPVAAFGPPDLAEAPAVPQGRADEEFVSGRITQAEVLEKYDLLAQALEQLDEVVARFPGHVGAQEQRVQLLRSFENELDPRLPAALSDLALARRAAGDWAGAREAAREAVAAVALPEAARRALEALTLVDPPEGAAAPPAAAEITQPIEAAALRSATEPQGSRAPRGSDILIDLDAELGHAAAAPEPAPQAVESPALIGADDDLSAIRAALEEELLAADADPIVPEEGPDQSLVEILRTFRERVEQELGSDHRMHYDLGIGYKEMGLVDEAIEAFGRAAQEASLRREACVMLAACHRERGEAQQAVQWYRAALEGEPEHTRLGQSLRYDLAETLLEAGDAAAALQQFRGVLEIDPTFRDVRGRVLDLEGSLQS